VKTPLLQQGEFQMPVYTKPETSGAG